MGIGLKRCCQLTVLHVQRYQPKLLMHSLESMLYQVFSFTLSLQFLLRVVISDQNGCCLEWNSTNSTCIFVVQIDVENLPLSNPNSQNILFMKILWILALFKLWIKFKTKLFWKFWLNWHGVNKILTLIAACRTKLELKI